MGDIMNKLNKIFLCIIVVLVIALGIVTSMYLNQRNFIYKHLGNYDFSFNEEQIESNNKEENNK